ncbi:hypothetical protein BRADI_3g56550v3 [Brachypodium distachyon]|uniref:histidine kinase n=1 Tax=Brachypodium distachyon TaxID=15368 RepID=A0A2K2D5D6_BRADI|nr:hypothetical protein BRADI_3g56550v3 [Brachypodium distachyon]
MPMAVRRCGGGCDGAVDAMLQCQKLAAFAVLGGAIHLLAVLTHHHPHSSGLLLASTAAKLLAVFVSFATALSLLTVIPRLLRAKLREALLRTKARQLDQDLGLIRRRVEATTRVARMFARHIRDAPPLDDPHAILHTTMLHLAHALSLHGCAVWLPGEGVLQLLHQLSLRDKGGAVVLGSQVSIPADDHDVLDVMSSEAAKVLRPGSALATASGGLQPPGAVAAIRMPMLKVSNFDGGRVSPEASSSAILVLVLPHKDGDSPRGWSSQDLEIVQVVADQVAVALSHAAVLEEWQSTRDKLAEQHRALLHAKHEAMAATNAVRSVQSALCGAMKRQMQPIVGLLSMLRQEGMRPDQRLVVDAIARTSTLALTLVNDADMETLAMSRVPFGLHALLREAMSVARCLAGCGGLGFSYRTENSLPQWVVGDETRVFHLLLHMVGTMLNRRCDGGAGCLSFSVKSCAAGEEERFGRDWIPMRPSLSPGCSIRVKFQVGLETPPGPGLPCAKSPRTPASSEMGLSFSMCNKIVQMMNGSMRSSASDGGSITVVLQFQLQQQSGLHRSRAPAPSIPHFDGLRVLAADGDGVSRAVTQKLLEKLGCQVTPVPSGAHCLGLLASAGSCFQLVLLDLDARAAASEMDVCEAALRIRELGSGGCWVLVVAALAGPGADDAGVREMCQRSGIHGVVQKPFTLAALGAQLSAVLENN